MSQIDTAVREHEERCNESIEKRLVPWTWMIGIVVVLLSSIGGVSWFLSSGYSAVNFKAEYNNEKCIKIGKRLDKIETMQADVQWIRSSIEKQNKTH